MTDRLIVRGGYYCPSIGYSINIMEGHGGKGLPSSTCDL